MEKKTKLIKRQKFILRTFWISVTATLSFWIGGVLSQSQMIKCEKGYVISYSFPFEALILFIVITLIIFIVMIVMFIIIGKKNKPKTVNAIEQIEKLGKLKERGLISEEEFEKEKRKLFDNY